MVIGENRPVVVAVIYLPFFFLGISFFFRSVEGGPRREVVIFAEGQR